MTFDQWKHQVDTELRKRVGLTSTSLPDVDYRGLYAIHDSPAEAAEFAIRNMEIA